MQRFPFYRKTLDEDPIVFGEKYSKCEYLDEKSRGMFSDYQCENKRWYAEDNCLYFQLFLFFIGYLSLAILVVY